VPNTSHDGTVHYETVRIFAWFHHRTMTSIFLQKISWSIFSHTLKHKQHYSVRKRWCAVKFFQATHVVRVNNDYCHLVKCSTRYSQIFYQNDGHNNADIHFLKITTFRQRKVKNKIKWKSTNTYCDAIQSMLELPDASYRQLNIKILI